MILYPPSDPVVVSAVLPRTAPTAGGTVIQVSFDVSPIDLATRPGLVNEDDLTVSVFGAQCPLVAGTLAVVSLPTHRVDCTLPEGTGAAPQVTVSLPTGSGTSTSVFSYDRPLITQQYPSVVQAGSTVTIIGLNFGTPGRTGGSIQVHWERPDHSACSRLDLSATAFPTHINDTALTVPMPSGVGTGWIPRVTVNGQVDASGDAWYEQSSWKLPESSTEGHVNPRPSYTVGFRRPQVLGVALASQDLLGIPSTGGVLLRIDASGLGAEGQACGFAASSSDPFSGGQHTVDAVTLQHPKFQLRSCSSPTFVRTGDASTSYVTCTVPPGVGGNWTVRVRVDGQLDTASFLDETSGGHTISPARVYSYNPPQLFATLPNANGEVGGGDEVVLLGSGFSALNFSDAAVFKHATASKDLQAEGQVIVHVGAHMAQHVTWSNDGRLVIVTPQGRGQQQLIQVCVMQQCSSSVVDPDAAINYFSFKAPRVDSVDPPFMFAGPHAPNFTLTGVHFGLEQADISMVTLAGVPCTSWVRLGATRVRCVALPAGAVDGALTISEGSVSVVGQGSVNTNTRHIRVLHQPQVVSIAPATADVGESVVIDVVDLVARDDTAERQAAGSSQVSIGGEACVGVVVTGITGSTGNVLTDSVTTRLKCTVPETQFKDVGLSVEVTNRVGVSSAPNTLFSYFGAGDVPPAPLALRANTVADDDGAARTIQYTFITLTDIASSASTTTSFEVYYTTNATTMTLGNAEAIAALEKQTHAVSDTTVEVLTVEQVLAEAAADISPELRSALQRAARRMQAANYEARRYTLADSVFQAPPYLFRVVAVNAAGRSPFSFPTPPIFDVCSDSQYLATNAPDLVDVVCTACPSGAYCGGQPAHRVVVRAGFWRTPWDPLIFAECDEPTACAGYEEDSDPSAFYVLPSALGMHSSAARMSESPDAVMRTVGNATTFVFANETSAGLASAADSCADGYTGTLCNRCAPNYARQGKAGCAQCSSPTLNVVALAGGSLLAVVVVGGMTFMALKAKGQPGKLPVAILKNLFTHLQVVAMAASFPLKWPGVVERMFTGIDAASSVSDQLVSPDCVASTTDVFSLLQGSAFFLRAIVMISLPWILFLFLAGFWLLHYGLGCPAIWERHVWNRMCCERCRDKDVQQGHSVHGLDVVGDAAPVDLGEDESKPKPPPAAASKVTGDVEVLDDTLKEKASPVAASGDEVVEVSSPSGAASSGPAVSIAPQHSSIRDPSPSHVALVPKPRPSLSASVSSSEEGSAAWATAAPRSPSDVPLPLATATKASEESEEEEETMGGDAMADERGYDSRAEARAESHLALKRATATAAALQAGASPKEATAKRSWDIASSSALHGKLSGQSHWSYFFVSVIVTAFLIHPTLTRITLRLFTCTSIDGSDDQFLVADKAVQCNDPSTAVWMYGVGVPFFVLYAFGIPAGAFAVLWSRRTQLQTDPNVRATFGFLYASFKPQYYWWEELTMLRKVLFAVMGVLLAPLGIVSQTMLALVVLTAFVVVHTRAMPFGKKLLNQQEMYSIITSILTLQGGLYLFACDNCGNETRLAVTGLIVTVNMAFIALTVYFLFMAVKYGNKVSSIERNLSVSTVCAAAGRFCNRLVSSGS